MQVAKLSLGFDSSLLVGTALSPLQVSQNLPVASHQQLAAIAS